jgi:ankyrin repeat protein
LNLRDITKVDSLIRSNIDLLTVMTPFGTWLHVASSFGKLEIVKHLIALGSKVNARGGTFDGNALNIAASGGYLDIVRYLLSCGAEMDVSEPKRNPLFGAIYGRSEETVKVLLEHGIDTHVKYTSSTMNNMDALAFAIERGEGKIADILRQH